MPFELDLNRGSVQLSANRFGLTTVESSPGRGIGSPHFQFYELEAVEVVDIILNDAHPDFEDQGGYTAIGKAKIRMVVSENGKEVSALSWAKPLDSNLKTYPLTHEIVIVARYLNELYYTQRLNVYNAPNENAVPGISEPKNMAQAGSTNETSAEGFESVAFTGTPNKQKDQNSISLGKIFKPNIEIKPIQPLEGDIIYEGRFGQSIRFSSNQESGLPSLKIKVGQPDDVPDTLLQPIEENINDDPSSLWIVNDENVPFISSTAGSEVNLEFYSGKPSEFLGNQIFINSDRVVLNSKTQEIMGFAKKAMNLVTEGIFTIDAVDDIITNTTSRTIINSPEIYLGGESKDEAIVLGNTLVDLLGKMIDLLITHTHPTGTGPSGPVLVPEMDELNKLKNNFKNILSSRNFSL